MMSEKIFSRASLVCGVSFVVIACALVGCGERGREVTVEKDPSAPASQADVKLKEQLRGQVEEREALSRTQQVIIRKMEAVAAKYGGDLKAASVDPEMISLIRRARDLEANFSSNRMHSAEMIRVRATKSVSEKEVNK